MSEDNKETSNKKSVKKKTESKVYSCSGYCNLIGASNGIRLVAKKKFIKTGKKTVLQWQEIFKEAKISQ